MENSDYIKELALLDKEKKLKEQIVESYRNRLVYEILSEKPEIDSSVKIMEKKTFWKKFFSLF